VTKNREELKQQLRDLVIRDFAMEKKLATPEVVDLLLEISELGIGEECVKRVTKKIEKSLSSRLYSKGEIQAILLNIVGEGLKRVKV